MARHTGKSSHMQLKRTASMVSKMFQERSLPHNYNCISLVSVHVILNMYIYCNCRPTNLNSKLRFNKPVEIHYYSMFSEDVLKKATLHTNKTQKCTFVKTTCDSLRNNNNKFTFKRDDLNNV